MHSAAFADTLDCDVLVVGGGAAGIRAALTAAALGRDTVLLSETPVGGSGSTFYRRSPPWGVLYAEDAQDAAAFEAEIMAASGACADARLVRTLAEESVTIRALLAREKLPLRTHAAMGLTGCFGSQPRGAVLTDLAAAQRLWRGALSRARRLRVVAGYQAVTLVQAGERIAGVTALDASGALSLWRARAVVLATGGAIGLYERSYAHGGLLGAGLAMAARHGAPTVNLEFVQFINGTLAPVYGLNYYQFAFVEQPRVHNARGEAFLAGYLPQGCTEERCLTLRGQHGPFSVEDEGKYFDLGIVAEARKRHGEGATIVPDPSRLTGSRYVHWREFLTSLGYSTATPMTVAPFCQAFNGGVRMLPGAHTDLPGLYVCGEVAGGCHGANRMGGNAMLATQVFGRLAGQSASQDCAGCAPPKVSKADAMAQFMAEMGAQTPCVPPDEALRTVRCTMQTYAFLERSEAGLLAARRDLAALRVNVPAALGTPAAQQAAQAANAVDAARLIVCAMRKRRDSRGGHNRTDYPAPDASLAAPIATRWPEAQQSG